MSIAVLHPGEMGVTVAQSLVDSGQDVVWIAEGRSDATAGRAANFRSLASEAELGDAADIVISVCPPSAAIEQAQRIREAGFGGIYVDANAVSPASAREIAAIFGASYVDGGIIGPPASKPGSTRLYLSGKRAPDIAGLFNGGALEAIAFAEGETDASVLKMAYAAFTKGSSALLLLVNALAASAGVRETLVKEWSISQPGVAERSEKTALGTSRKAWRFVGEMEEIARTFESFGLPGEFHAGAAQLYERMAELKDLPPAELETVMAKILDSS